MKTSLKYLSVISLIAVFLVAGFVLFPEKQAGANPAVFNVKPPLTVGTTTPTTASTTFASYSFIKAGVSTTTGQILDSYASGTYGTLDSAALLIQLTATSTPPTLKFRFEYSQDGIDWYSEDIALTANATTTVHVRDFAEHSWVFASTTAVGSTANRNHKIVTVATPTRFVRPVFYLPPGSPDAAVFHQWVSKSQR